MKNLLLVTAVLCSANSGFAQTWTKTGPGINWSSVAASADGNKMAVAGNNSIYLSTNSGATWQPSSAPSRYWSSIASSADGSKLVAAAVQGGAAPIPGGIYTSTNSGAAWSSNNVLNLNNWNAVASSSDGTRFVAASGPYSNPIGPICISTNSGNTWTQTSAPVTNWCSVASSASGSKLLAGTFGGPAYLSTNSGDAWIQQTNLPSARWTTMATSADGNTLMAAAYQVGSGFGGIYISTNSGMVWTRANAPTNQYWLAFCSSADGSKLAVIGYGFLYSTNSGSTWTSNSSPNIFAKWSGMASSADGNTLVLADGGSIGIYTSQTTPAPAINLAPANGNLTFSWTVPSTNFVMQQSSDLGSWTDVTNKPALNLTNLQNEVTLPMSSGSGFYRLKTQ